MCTKGIFVKSILITMFLVMAAFSQATFANPSLNENEVRVDIDKKKIELARLNGALEQAKKNRKKDNYIFVPAAIITALVSYKLMRLAKDAALDFIDTSDLVRAGGYFAGSASAGSIAVIVLSQHEVISIQEEIDERIESLEQLEELL